MRNRLNRRSFLQRVAGASVISGGALAIIASGARAQAITDTDDGGKRDPAGHGRGEQPRAPVRDRRYLDFDNDAGPKGDYAPGQRTCGETGRTDSDAGPRSDARGHGRTGVTDSDSGPDTDFGLCGRGQRTGN